MEQKFHHIGVCIAFESERACIRGVFVSEREVNAEAFSTCKGVVIIIGGGIWSILYIWQLCFSYTNLQAFLSRYTRMLAFLPPSPPLSPPIHTKQHYWMNLLCQFNDDSDDDDIWPVGMLTETLLCDFRQTTWLSIGIVSITETA